ncbi:MAG: hypothetical protein QG657_4175 [Acidobacteriota bacterium]|nr:hypothetical protein [Acidobacteriota bacterium]
MEEFVIDLLDFIYFFHCSLIISFFPDFFNNFAHCGGLKTAYGGNYVFKAVLKDQPQLLEVLGIQVLSNGYRRQIPGFEGS